MLKRKLLLIIAIFFLIVCLYLYKQLFYSNTNFEESKKYLYIHSNHQYNDLIQTIQDSALLNNIASFDFWAKIWGLEKNISPGRYEITKNMGNYTLINKIKKGAQSPVKVVINKLRTPQDIARKLAYYLETDSLTWMNIFNDKTFLQKYEIDSFGVQSLIMPNTYEIYWNTNAEKVIEKLYNYKNQFWNENRLKKAKLIRLTPYQVTTIAAIVNEETNKKDEKNKIAGVYLNRYRIGMKLGADPTVKYAVGDFTLKRILNKHTQTISPYNTYMVDGLPPGPICTPSAEDIDAVLNADTTQSYLFFCAKEDFSGYHNFAKNYTEHLINAKMYQDALNKRNIK